MLIARIPGLLAKSFKRMTWSLPGNDNEVYLTFDDGPTPEITQWVLDKLDEYDAKATFFCLGNNVEKHPEVYHSIKERGHAVGNHTFSHVKGFGCSLESYVQDVEQASQLIDSRLFRPPYGRILPRQVKEIKARGYRIIMWSVLSVDYNRNISGNQVVKNVTGNVRPGSIIVFHDSVKASENLYVALPEVLRFLKAREFNMCRIGD